MSKIVQIGKKDDTCQFCGKPEHKGYWGCPRIRAVTMDCDGSWAVEFVEMDIFFTPDDPEVIDDGES